MIPAALALGGAMAASSLLGKKGGGNNNAMKFLQMAYDQFGNLRVPTPEEMQIQVQNLIQQGILTPEQAQTVMTNPSAYMDIQEDPTVRRAQMGSLEKLQGIVNADGLDAQGKADVADIIRSLDTSQKGARGAIVQNAAARGVGGSGLELANQLTASQDASTNASQQGMDAAAQAEQRALAAIAQTGQLSGQIRGQDYTKASDKAAAMDAIEKFNTANKQNVINTNVASRNAAAATNLATKQRISDTNVANTNTNKVRNADLIQANFDNEMKKKAGMTGQLGNMANLAAKTDESDDAFRNALLGAGGQIIAGYAGRK